jgi:hypothetical protein
MSITFGKSDAINKLKLKNISIKKIINWLSANKYKEVYDPFGNVIIDKLPCGTTIYYNYDERNKLSHFYTTLGYYGNYEYDDDNLIYFEDNEGVAEYYD